MGTAYYSIQRVTRSLSTLTLGLPQHAAACCAGRTLSALFRPFPPTRAHHPRTRMHRVNIAKECEPAHKAFAAKFSSKTILKHVAKTQSDLTKTHVTSRPPVHHSLAAPDEDGDPIQEIMDRHNNELLLRDMVHTIALEEGEKQGKTLGSNQPTASVGAGLGPMGNAPQDGGPGIFLEEGIRLRLTK